MVGDARQEITVEGSSRRRSLGGGGEWSSPKRLRGWLI